MEETATPQHCSSSLLQHYSTPLHHHNMFSTPAVPSGILRLEPLYPCTTLSLNNNPLLYNTAQQPRPVPQHLPFYPQLTHMKSAYDKTTTTTVVEEEEESEKDRRLSIDFLLHQDSRPALYRHNSNTTRQPPTYPQGDEDYQDVVPAVTNLVPPPFNLFSYPHNNHSNNYNDLHCYSSISNHNNHCNDDDGTKHNLALPTFNGKKTRRRLRHEELYLLESVYAHNQTPDSFTKIKLSQLLYMTPQQVSNWYVPIPFFLFIHYNFPLPVCSILSPRRFLFIFNFACAFLFFLPRSKLGSNNFNPLTKSKGPKIANHFCVFFFPPPGAWANTSAFSLQVVVFMNFLLPNR